MTLMDKSIIKEMLENDGIYPGDPQMYSIYSYTHANTGEKLFAIFSSYRYCDIHISPYVKDPVLLWSVHTGITKEGEIWLKKN